MQARPTLGRAGARLVLGAVALLLAAGCGGHSRASHPHLLVYATDTKLAGSDDWIWRARADGSNRVRLTRGSSPELAPNGLLVAFFRTRGGFKLPKAVEIYVMSSSGGRPRLLRRVLGTTALVFSLVWSPNSRRLASGETHGLFLTDLDNGRARLVAGTAGGGVTYFSFAPDGHAIVYELDGFAGSDLYIYDLAHDRARRITHDHRASSPVWGAHAIAFKRGRSLWRGDLWLADANGGHLRRLTHTGAGIYPAAWSADGARLVAANPGDVGRLWAVDAQTGRARNLTGWVRDLSPQGLSRDGSTILARRGCSDLENPRGVLETIPFAGAKPRVIVKGPCYASWNR